MSTAKNWEITNALVQEVSGQVRQTGEDLEMPPSVDQEIGSCIARAG